MKKNQAPAPSSQNHRQASPPADNIHSLKAYRKKKQNRLKIRPQEQLVKKQAVSSSPKRELPPPLKITPSSKVLTPPPDDNLQEETNAPPRSPWAFASAAAAACLLLVLAPLLPRYLAFNDRQVASFSCPPTDGECLRKVKRRCSEQELTHPQYQKCQKQVWDKIQQRRNKRSQYKKDRLLHLIKTGHRKVASVGFLPGPLDVFSVEVLNSRYDIQSRGRRVKSVTLTKGSKPVPLPDMEKTFKEFSSLFPFHQGMRKKTGSQGEGHLVYELLNASKRVVSEVVVVTDKKGRLLSLRVQRQ